jgi:hypothetical protein
MVSGHLLELLSSLIEGATNIVEMCYLRSSHSFLVHVENYQAAKNSTLLGVETTPEIVCLQQPSMTSTLRTRACGALVEKYGFKDQASAEGLRVWVIRDTTDPCACVA